MIDELRDRIVTYLSQNQVCVISTSGRQGAWSVTAQYQNLGLELECRVPRRSDAIYHLAQDPHVLVIILDAQSNSSRWLQYRGIARIDSAAAGDRYIAVHLTPERVDLMDESRDWGARETLDVKRSNCPLFSSALMASGAKSWSFCNTFCPGICTTNTDPRGAIVLLNKVKLRRKHANRSKPRPGTSRSPRVPHL